MFFGVAGVLETSNCFEIWYFFLFASGTFLFAPRRGLVEATKKGAGTMWVLWGKEPRELREGLQRGSRERASRGPDPPLTTTS